MIELPRLDGVTWREAINAGSAYLFTHTALFSTQDATDAEHALGEARYLLQHCLGKTNLDLILEPAARLDPQQAKAYAVCLVRRARHEPVARIIGKREFYGRDFVISSATLDPRPDSETLIDAALARVPKSGKGVRVLDIGTGSGCLLLTLLAELPEAQGVGIDPSLDALAVAEKNARSLGIGDRVQWVHGRFGDLQNQIGCAFNLVISNPPYIPSLDIPALEADVRDFDPHLALDGGADGLNIYREIARGLKTVVQSGWVIFEIGSSQANQLIEIIKLLSPDVVPAPNGVLADMAGRPRCVVFQVRHSLSPI